MNIFADTPQTLTAWQGTGTKDQFGNYTAYTATVINCRIVEKFIKTIDSKGIEIISSHNIRCKEQPNINSLIDLTNGTTFNRQNCREIRAKQEIRNVQNEVEWWKIWL